MFNPNAVFISPSTLSDFDRCPQLYYYRSVYRNPQTNLKIQIISPALTLGQTVHETIDRFVSDATTVKSFSELEKIYEWFWGQMTGEKGGFFSSDLEKNYKDRGKEMLARFFKNEHFRTHKPTKLPSFPKLEMGDDIILTGKVDWIEDKGTFFHIVDFKTGQKEERDNSKQLPIYAILTKGVLKVEEVKVSYWYLDKNDELTDFSLPDLEKEYKLLKQKGLVLKMARQTSSFRCSSGYETCRYCQDFVAVSKGKGKMVSMDTFNRKQEIYVMPPKEEKVEEHEDLPF